MTDASSRRSTRDQPADQCPGPTALPLTEDVGEPPIGSNADLGSRAVEVELIAESDRYDVEDTRWSEQVALLLRDLRLEGAGVRVVSTSAAGSKGGVETVILALGSAQAFTAAVKVFKAWLARDRTRSLSILVQEGNTRRQLVIKGVDLDREGFRELASLGIRHGFRE